MHQLLVQFESSSSRSSDQDGVYDVGVPPTWSSVPPTRSSGGLSPPLASAGGRSGRPGEAGGASPATVRDKAKEEMPPSLRGAGAREHRVRTQEARGSGAMAGRGAGIVLRDRSLRDAATSKRGGREGVRSDGAIALSSVMSNSSCTNVVYVSSGCSSSSSSDNGGGGRGRSPGGAEGTGANAVSSDSSTRLVALADKDNKYSSSGSSGSTDGVEHGNSKRDQPLLRGWKHPSERGTTADLHSNTATNRSPTTTITSTTTTTVPAPRSAASALSSSPMRTWGRHSPRAGGGGVTTAIATPPRQRKTIVSPRLSGMSSSKAAIVSRKGDGSGGSDGSDGSGGRHEKGGIVSFWKHGVEDG